MNDPQKEDAFLSRNHDHRLCVSGALQSAEEVCTRRGARLTALRRRVLELVWDSHAPVGAYDILERLFSLGRRAAPITVYRALDFLMDHGLVHRLASLNAYVGCGSSGAPHNAQFLICKACGTAAELNDARIDRAIARGAARTGFTVGGSVVEIRGLCPDCGGN